MQGQQVRPLRVATVFTPAVRVFLEQESSRLGVRMADVIKLAVHEYRTARADADALKQHDQLQSAQREELTETARRTTESLDGGGVIDHDPRRAGRIDIGQQTRDSRTR